MGPLDTDAVVPGGIPLGRCFSIMADTGKFESSLTPEEWYSLTSEPFFCEEEE